MLQHAPVHSSYTVPVNQLNSSGDLNTLTHTRETIKQSLTCIPTQHTCSLDPGRLDAAANAVLPLAS